ncbi:hypothetical protein [Rhodococcus koreensis]
MTLDKPWAGQLCRGDVGAQAFTRTLSLEIGPFGNAVAPGFIDTGMTDATGTRLQIEIDDFRRMVVAGRRVIPCSRRSFLITGQES